MSDIDDNDLGGLPDMTQESHDNQDLLTSDPFQGLRPDWKPTGQRPIPTLPCYYVRPDGTKCKNRGIRGTGLNGTNAVCRYHGGALPHVKEHAQAIVDGARLKLLENSELAVDTVIDLLGVGTADQVRLKAAEMVMNRAGIKDSVDLNVEVKHSVNPSELLADRLKSISERLNPQDEEEEYIEVDPEEED